MGSDGRLHRLEDLVVRLAQILMEDLLIGLYWAILVLWLAFVWCFGFNPFRRIKSKKD